MLAKQNTNQQCEHVQFVSYTGKWPILCDGILVLKINGTKYDFGTYSNKYPRFWSSGGSCFRNQTETNEWIIYYDKLPDELKPYAEEIDTVFNQNVEHGCCGGCK